MPRKREHDAIEHLLLGKVTKMSELMDIPSKYLKNRHRVLWHDPISVGVLSFVAGGNPLENWIAGMTHLLLDNILNDYAKSKKGGKEKRQKVNKMI